MCIRDRDNAEKYRKERQAWFDANMEVVNGKKQPKVSIYGNKAYQNLNPAQKEYYNKIMEIKAKLDSYLPDKYTTLTNAVKIRKMCIRDRVFTVCFKKQDKPKSKRKLQEEIEAIVEQFSNSIDTVKTVSYTHLIYRWW